MKPPTRGNVDHWVTRLAVVTDWYDGPRAGLCWLETREFRFDLLAERPAPDGLDDRLFAISAVPAGTTADLVRRLASLGSPQGRIWVPRWKHEDPAVLQTLEASLKQVCESAEEPNEVVLTSDMQQFRAHWRLDPKALAAAGAADADWFAFLSV